MQLESVGSEAAWQILTLSEICQTAHRQTERQDHPFIIVDKIWFIKDRTVLKNKKRFWLHNITNSDRKIFLTDTQSDVGHKITSGVLIPVSGNLLGKM